MTVSQRGSGLKSIRRELGERMGAANLKVQFTNVVGLK